MIAGKAIFRRRDVSSIVKAEKEVNLGVSVRSSMYLVIRVSLL